MARRERNPSEAKAFGARLRAARLAANHQIASRFASLVSAEANTVYRIERGEMWPSVVTVSLWAKACGVTTDSLLDGLDTSSTLATNAEPASPAQTDSGVEAAE